MILNMCFIDIVTLTNYEDGVAIVLEQVNQQL